jgi:hypothetical protein
MWNLGCYITRSSRFIRVTYGLGPVLCVLSPMALTALVGPWPPFYTDGRTPWTVDQPVARPFPTHRTTQTQNKRIHKHPYVEWDANPRSQRSSERRQFMPYTARPLWSAQFVVRTGKSNQGRWETRKQFRCRNSLRCWQTDYRFHLHRIESESLRFYKGTDPFVLHRILVYLLSQLIPLKLRASLYSIVVIQNRLDLTRVDSKLYWCIMRLRKVKRGRPGRRRENSIKMNLREMWCKCGGRWMELAQDHVE